MEEIAFSFSGGSRGEVASLVVETLSVELTGGSQLMLATGEVDQQSVEASGGSNYIARSAIINLNNGLGKLAY